jgi:hypothetical protein
MSRRACLPALLALIALLFASCGGGSSSGGSTPRASNGSPQSGTASDEAYLKVICGGTDQFYNAVQTSSTADGISKAIKDFIADLQKVTPPADLQQFNKEFIKYLQDAVDNPTSLLSTNPPLPPEKARDRLVSKEKDVEECKNPTFLDASNPPGPASSPTAAPSP